MPHMEDGYLALFIAVVTDCSMEQAFQRLEHGGVYYKLQEMDIPEIIRLKEGGKTYKELGEIYGVHYTYVQQQVKKYAKKHNIMIQTRKQIVTKEMVAMHQKGRPLSEISKLYGTSPSVTQKRINRYKSKEAKIKCS